MATTMITNDAEVGIPQLAECALPDPPPIPQLPASGSKREQVLRAYAERVVDRMGRTAAMWLIAELEEAIADARETRP
jgi:hypothetical protein